MESGMLCDKCNRKAALNSAYVLCYTAALYNILQMERRRPGLAYRIPSPVSESKTQPNIMMVEWMISKVRPQKNTKVH